MKDGGQGRVAYLLVGSSRIPIVLELGHFAYGSL